MHHALPTPHHVPWVLAAAAAMLGARTAWANPIAIGPTSPIGASLMLLPLSFAALLVFGGLFATRAKKPKEDRWRRRYRTWALSALAVFVVSFVVIGLSMASGRG